MKSTMNRETRLRVLQREVDSLRRQLSIASANQSRKGDDERKSIEENFSRITSTAIKLLGPVSIPEIFRITVDQLYSLVPDSLIGFAEFDQFHKDVIIREVKCSDQDYKKMIQVFGCDPKGYAFNFIDEIRTKLIPGGLQVIKGGFYELVFKKLPRSLCTEFEMQLETGKIFAMPCAVENEIMGVFSIITRQRSEDLDNKHIIEAIVNQAAMTLRRKRLEEAHLESEEKFIAAFHINPDPLVISIPDGTILDANTSFLNLLQRTRAEVIGHNSQSLNIFSDPADRLKLYQVLNEIGHISNQEIKVMRKSGEVRTALISSEKLKAHKEKAVLTVLHDITERKTVMDALCRSEERYRQLVESANSIIMRWDVSGAILFVNNFGLRFFGYTGEEIIGEDIRVLVPHQDRTGRSLDGLIDEIIHDPENYLQSENENIRKNGEKVWVRWANRPIHDSRGTIVEILSIGIDVTETIRFEESLKTEHDILDAVVNNADIGFLVIQPDGAVILHNEQALMIHEVSLGENETFNLNNFVDTYILEYPDGRRLENSEWPFALAMHNEFVKNFEVRLIRLRSRTSRMISLSSIPVYDAAGSVKLIVFTITDFTEIYERTKALEESQQRYDSLFNNATMAIQHCRIVTDENGHPVDYEMFNINNTVTKLIGITKEDVYGKRATDIFPGLNEGPFNFIEHFGKVALEGGELNAEVFFEQLGKWLSIYAYCPKKGEFTAFFSDITPRKLAEIEVQKAKEKAEESDRLKSAFLANMSHEIRTPMNGILGFADLLKNQNLSGEKQQQYVEAINMSGSRMLSIINDLIDISKIEAGQIEVRKINTDVPRLLKEVVTFFRPEAEKSKISLSLNLWNMPTAEFFIETDKTKLYQITSNLVKNALKFTKADGFIELGCRINEHDIFFYVKDNGIGIREELREKIFERFRQGDTAEEHEGVGLGLAISKAYVELLGGKIGVESEAGKGSVFYFTLPFHGNTLPFQAAAPDSGISDKALASKKILIVEDDEMSFVLLKEILGGRNLEIVRALNGLEAVEIIRNNKDIDLILMDVKLPVMDGIEATTEIKKINPHIPVIMQSAYAGQEEIERAFNAGSDDYMTKPINAEKFLNRINELVS